MEVVFRVGLQKYLSTEIGSSKSPLILNTISIINPFRCIMDKSVFPNSNQRKVEQACRSKVRKSNEDDIDSDIFADDLFGNDELTNIDDDIFDDN